MTARAKIKEFIVNNLNEFEDVTAGFSDNDNIFELGLVNSLFAMKLINYVKNEFNIKIVSDDLEITNFNSVNNILKFIKKKQSLFIPSRVYHK